jgi:chorismate mutase
MDIEELRRQIDAIDDQLLKLFNERAKLAREIGLTKKGLGLPIYMPNREQEILERLQRDNPGPISSEAIKRVYQQLFAESKRLEEEICSPEEQ